MHKLNRRSFLNGHVAAYAFLALLMIMPADRALAQVRLGLLGGANFSALKDMTAGESPVELDNATGYHIGAFLDIGFGAFGIRPAVYYLDAGPLFEGADFLDRDDFNLVYVSVPLDLRYSLGVGPIKPYLLAGPELRILTSAQEAPEALKDQLSDLVMNGGVGLGVEISIPGVGLTLYPQIRYSFSLSEWLDRSYEIEGISITTDDGQKPNMWLLSLGVGF
jgi:Outer membrane protein beta-barrel domain